MRKEKRTPLVSVVIPCYNGIRTMERTLGALAAQKTETPYEVIVVDSSDDGTDRMIAEKYPDVRLFHLPEKTLPGSGRNLGVKKSRGKYIAFPNLFFS